MIIAGKLEETRVIAEAMLEAVTCILLTYWRPSLRPAFSCLQPRRAQGDCCRSGAVVSLSVPVAERRATKEGSWCRGLASIRA